MNKIKLPKPLNLIRIWADWNRIPYEAKPDVIGEPRMYKLIFHKRHKYRVKISGSELDETVCYNNEKIQDYVYEWMDPYEAIAKLKEAVSAKDT